MEFIVWQGLHWQTAFTNMSVVFVGCLPDLVRMLLSKWSLMIIYIWPPFTTRDLKFPKILLFWCALYHVLGMAEARKFRVDDCCPDSTTCYVCCRCFDVIIWKLRHSVLSVSVCVSRTAFPWVKRKDVRKFRWLFYLFSQVLQFGLVKKVCRIFSSFLVANAL